ncbi:hypothetical protein BD410DRAFT_782219 [Rickenella mellea]|uniref:Uncharacterized protein n=1 Tax=Rickenella mellea TaxID=50990 RepID=A0A4Y7QKS1_9AGAM|nr:hypothetical protein BD410DRAFT_782219 [Rickenella mellea]
MAGEQDHYLQHNHIPMQAPMGEMHLQHTDSDPNLQPHLQGPSFQVHVQQSPSKSSYGSGDFDDGYTLVFANMEEFQNWRVHEEEEKMVEFVKGDTHGSKAVPPRFRDHTKLVCARHSRSGRKKYVKKHPERQRKVPSRKIEGEGCPASISYKTYYGTDMVRAMYVSTHSHEIGPANLPYTKRGRKAAAELDRMRTRSSGAYRANPVLNGTLEALSPQSSSSISGESLTTSPTMQHLSVATQSSPSLHHITAQSHPGPSSARLAPELSASELASPHVQHVGIHSPQILNTPTHGSQESHGHETLHMSPHMHHLGGHSPQAVPSPAHNGHQPQETNSLHASPHMHHLGDPSSVQQTHLHHHHQHHHQHIATPSPTVTNTASPMMHHAHAPHQHQPAPPPPSDLPYTPPLPVAQTDSFAPPQPAILEHERWDRMSVLFQSIRENARSFEYPSPSVAALESVLVRLYLESPITTPREPPPVQQQSAVDGMNNMGMNDMTHMHAMNSMHGMGVLNGVNDNTN